MYFYVRTRVQVFPSIKHMSIYNGVCTLGNCLISRPYRGCSQPRYGSLIFTYVEYTCYFSLPVPPALYPDSDVDVNAARGSTVSFQFQVSGQPEPTVVWERESQRMITSGRVVITTSDGVTSLTVHDVAREDEGLYVCCAMNHLGNTIQECQITLLGTCIYTYMHMYTCIH